MERKQGAIILLAFLAVLIILGIFIAQSFKKVKYIEALPGELVRMVKADAFCYRNEKPLFAPSDGKLELLVDNNTRVPAKTAIAMVNSYSVYAEHAGLVCFLADGLENILNPGILMALKHEFLADWDKTPKQVPSGAVVYKGDLIGRLIDNYAWHLVVFSKESFFKNEEIVIEIGANSYKGIVSEVLNDNRFSVKIEKFDKDVPTYRVLRDIAIYKNPLMGVIIPSDLLIETDEGSYVRITYKNKERMQPVRIVGKWQNEVVVDGLPLGSYVVFAP